MKKRGISLLLCLALLISTLCCFSGISVSAAEIFDNPVSATVDVAPTGATQNQKNMALRADAMYGAMWTAKATCYGWGGSYTFSKGNDYRVPYGQPVNAGKYVGFSISVPDFLKATTSASNEFYTKKSTYNKTSTYYCNDCSAFVSYCWGTSRNTTSSIPNISTSYGLCNSSNVDKIKLGDCLNNAGSHVVLVSAVSYNSSGTVTSVEITEQTPPQLKRTTYTRSGLTAKYGSSYYIRRYSGSVPAPYYTFTFNANGGSGTMSSQKAIYGSTTTISANKFTKSGYKFAGWNVHRTSINKWKYTNGTTSGWYEKGSQPSGYSLAVYKDETEVTKTGYGVSDTVDLVATWKKADTSKFTFEFDANGGTGTMADQTITYGTDTAISKNKFKNEGYTFEGWYVYRNETKEWRYMNLDGTKGWYKKGSQPTGYYRQRYDDETVVAKTGLGTGDIVTLYATWGSGNYTIKYDANGGSGTLADMSAIGGCEKALRTNTFTKSKNTFGGWTFTRSSDNKTYYILNSDSNKRGWYVPGEQPLGYRKLIYSDQKVISKLNGAPNDVVTAHAYWIPKTTGTKTFYIDYDANGGSGTMARTTVVKGTNTATRTNKFTRPGYKFLGWMAYRSSDDKWRFKSSTTSGDQWAKYGDEDDAYDRIVTYSDGVEVANTSGVDCDVITFYAGWEEDFKFTFVFDANGGTGTMTNQLVKYGVDTPISKNKFTKPGYKFGGWTVYREATGKFKYTNGTDSGWYKEGAQPTGYTKSIYGDEITVSKTGTGLDDTVKLTAVWEEDFKFTFRFEPNGGTGTMPDQLVKYGTDTVVNKNQFVRRGYKFVGWEVYRQATGLWRYKNSEGTIKWFEKGKQTDGYEISVYKDEVTVSKTGLGLDDIVILSAVWEEDFKFTFVYDANGGTGTMPNQVVTYGEPTAMSKNLFTREGYNFVGWEIYRQETGEFKYKNSEGTIGWFAKGQEPEDYTISVYNDETVVKKTGLGIDDIVIAYAVWEEIPKPVLGNLNDDEEIDVRDVTCLQILLSTTINLTPEQIEVCDVNRDGVVNVRDVTYLQKFIANLVDTL